MNQETILNGLNEEQCKAASHRDGPLVIFAGAGSGKTRVITTRIAYLIETGVAPESILAMTFTNKAAGEMKSRVAALTPLGVRCHTATFHSACARWLREFASELGFTSDFTIYDEADTLSALKAIIKEVPAGSEVALVAPAMASFIEKAKMYALLPTDGPRFGTDFPEDIPPGGIIVYKRYQEVLALSNAMDFGDLILNMLLLLKNHENIRRILQNRYRYVLVDEYQDTNRTQCELIGWLVERSRNLCVVGDDDQSIYSWRGATPGNILDFDKLWPDAVKITLGQNYRCSGTIVSAAAAMISNNKRRVCKDLFTDNPPGLPITYRLEGDGQLEARWVAEAIKRDCYQWPTVDTAVFYRTNAQSRLLEEAFREQDIPYRMYGGTPFYDRLEIKDLVAFFRLFVNKDDNVAFRRVVNVPPRKIGDKSVEAIESESLRKGLSLMRTVEQMMKDSDPLLNPRVAAFCDMINRLGEDIRKSPLPKVLGILLEAVPYQDYIAKKFPDQSLDKLENVHELGAAMADYYKRADDVSLNAWLQSISLSNGEEQDFQGVSMMTLHMAKGLEFKRVFITGVEDGLIPHRSNEDDADMLEEERRLFYVGMTRAREKLVIVSAWRRRTFDRWLSNMPSRFLKEIPQKYFKFEDQGYYNGAANSFDDSPETEESVTYEYELVLEPGTPVFHKTYGRGVIEDVSQEYGRASVVVRFDDVGLRRIEPGKLSPVSR